MSKKGKKEWGRKGRNRKKREAEDRKMRERKKEEKEIAEEGRRVDLGRAGKEKQWREDGNHS